MQKKQRAFNYMPSIDFPENMNIRFVVWRKNKDFENKIFLNIVDYADIQLGDILFCENKSFCGYVRLVDIVRHEDGKLSDYIMEDLNIELDKSVLMAKTTKRAVNEYLKASDDEKACVVISLKQKEQSSKPQEQDPDGPEQ